MISSKSGEVSKLLINSYRSHLVSENDRLALLSKLQNQNIPFSQDEIEYIIFKATLSLKKVVLNNNDSKAIFNTIHLPSDKYDLYASKIKGKLHISIFSKQECAEAGTFGKVYEGFDIINGMKLIRKSAENNLYVNRKEKIDSHLDELENEINHLEDLSQGLKKAGIQESPLFVYDFRTLNGPVGYITKKYEEDLFNPNRKLSQADLVNGIRQLLQGCKYIHDRGYAHCDIKPENCYLEINLSNSIHFVLGDFGASKKLDAEDDDLIELDINYFGKTLKHLLKYHNTIFETALHQRLLGFANDLKNSKIKSFEDALLKFDEILI